jgi:hypothetical protein
VNDIPETGLDVTVEAGPDEREALARAFKLPAVHALTGTFLVTGTRSRIHVSGRVDARIEQVCVVTLDPFENEVHEDVEVDFASSPAASSAAGDTPDEIVDGAIDLGALTAEFLALGIDPHPRKPGVDFAFEPGDDPASSPFAALEKLRRGE